MRKNYSIQRLFKTFAVAIAVMVTVLAVNPPAHAEIVYHSADIGISNGTYNLDVNGDGVTDFTIASTGSAGSCGAFCTYGETSLDEAPASGNGAIVGPLKRGQEIGPNEVFHGSQALMSILKFERICGDGACKYFIVRGGSWFGKTGYLGLSFQVNGQTYYGWARLSVGGGTGTLLGYAYETIPGKAILAGQTSYAWLSPISLNFGTVPVGTTLSNSITLENLGSSTLTITNASLTGAQAADFASLNGNPPCSGSLAAGAECVLTFSFTPSIVGKEHATYSVYDDGGGSPQELPLTGTGQ